jgi:Fe-S cluster assembly ATPase SufC
LSFQYPAGIVEFSIQWLYSAENKTVLGFQRNAKSLREIRITEIDRKFLRSLNEGFSGGEKT